MKNLFILILFTSLFSTSSFAQCLNANVSYTNVNCFGGSDGTITITPTNGQAPYTYTWSTGTITVSGGHTITNLVANTSHTVTVEDNLGCDRIVHTTLAQPTSLIAANLSITSNYNGANISCNGAGDGEATVTASGGTPPYSYTWSNGASVTSTNTSLTVGIHEVSVTDANGCLVVSTITLTEPSTVSAAITSSTNVICPGTCTGSATVSASGGLGVYTYIWPPGGVTSSTVNNLCAGVYCPTITDLNGCQATTCVTITEPAAVIGNISQISGITCTGAATGSLSVTLSGGPYTYIWSTSGQTTSTISNLVAGTYCVTATNTTTGCSWTSCATLLDPPPVNVSTTNVLNPTCSYSCDGSFDIVVTGGNPGYQFSIDGGLTFSTNNNFSNLCSGQYNIVVQDASGCFGYDTLVSSAPTPISVQIAVQDTACQGQGIGGNLLGVVNGGIGAYTYNWSHATINNPTSYNAAGNYCLTVTDANGCTATTCSNVNTANFEVNITNAILTNSQKYGISNQNYPMTIQTSSSHPSQTQYNWTPATGLSCTNCPNPTALVGAPTQYILNTTHTNLGCMSSDTITIYPAYPDTLLFTLAPDSTITYCSTDIPPFLTGVTSTGVGPLSYGSITYGLTGCFDYTSNGQEGIDTLLWIDCATVNVNGFPLQICDTTIIHLRVASCVWPGDTDNDGIANNFDLLPIGQHYGTTGYNRDNASTNYTCQPSLNWGASISGMPAVDLKHVDTDGNATINGNDTNAIILNWAQTHLKNNMNFLTGVDIYVDTATIAPGDTVRLPIVLGTTAVPNGYGIAFTINYDPIGIDTGTVSMDFNNSWLGTINSDMIGIHKDFYYQGQTEVALTRIDQIPVTGHGAIAHINFTIKDDVLPKSTAIRFDFNITNIRLIDPSGTIIPVTGVPTQVLVTDAVTSVEQPSLKGNSKINAFPNPTTGQLQIQSSIEKIETVSLYNLTGNLVYQKENIQRLSSSIDLSDLPVGVYMATVITEKGRKSLKVIKK